VPSPVTTTPRDHGPRPEVPTHVSPQDAADLCGVSVDTIRRRIKAGTIPGATRLGDRPTDPWSLPVSGLIAAGLCTQEALDELAVSLPPDVEELLSRVAELEVALEAERASARRREDHLNDLLARANTELERLWNTVDRLTGGPHLARSA
jgi:hypothetical protein